MSVIVVDASIGRPDVDCGPTTFQQFGRNALGRQHSLGRRPADALTTEVSRFTFASPRDTVDVHVLSEIPSRLVTAGAIEFQRPIRGPIMPAPCRAQLELETLESRRLLSSPASLVLAPQVAPAVAAVVFPTGTDDNSQSGIVFRPSSGAERTHSSGDQLENDDFAHSSATADSSQGGQQTSQTTPPAQSVHQDDSSQAIAVDSSEVDNSGAATPVKTVSATESDDSAQNSSSASRVTTNHEDDKTTATTTSDSSNQADDDGTDATRSAAAGAGSSDDGQSEQQASPPSTDDGSVARPIPQQGSGETTTDDPSNSSGNQVNPVATSTADNTPPANVPASNQSTVSSETPALDQGSDPSGPASQQSPASVVNSGNQTAQSQTESSPQGPQESSPARSVTTSASTPTSPATEGESRRPSATIADSHSGLGSAVLTATAGQATTLGVERLSPLPAEPGGGSTVTPRLQSESAAGADARPLILDPAAEPAVPAENLTGADGATALMEMDRVGSELQESDHRTAILSFDAEALRSGVQSFLAGLDRAGAALAASPLGLSMYWWLLTAMVAGTAGEIARRQWKQTSRPALGHTDDLLFGWYPERNAGESGSRV